MECHRVLKETGSLYLHCDPKMSHYLKLLLDCIFGEKHFRNEIIWWYDTGGMAKSKWSSKHDVIFYYSKRDYIFNVQKVMEYKNKKQQEKFQKYGAKCNWSRVSSIKKYPHDVWKIHAINSMAKERTGYPTQKPVKLLEKIIKASSNEGDVVLDPFCGCATTCVAAEKLNRKWIGIDISHKAYELIKTRCIREVNSLFNWNEEIKYQTSPPVRSDLEVNFREQKFVYVISNPKIPDEYKVGVAKDWEKRLNSYQTADADRAYRMEFKYSTPRFNEIEKYIHAKFSNRYEWIRADLKTIIDEIKKF